MGSLEFNLNSVLVERNAGLLSGCALRGGPCWVPVPSCRSLDLNRNSVLVERTLGRFQDARYAEAVLRVTEGNLAVAHTLDEMLSFEAQGLCHVNSRNPDVTEPDVDGIAVGADIWRLGLVVVDAQLLFRLGIIKDGHFLAADDRSLAHLVWIQPAQVNVRHDAVFKEETKENHIFDTGLDIALSTNAHIGGKHFQHEQYLGDVVRSEAPQCVFILTNAAQVYPLGVDVINLSEFPRLNQTLEAANDQVVFQQVAHHEHAISLVGEFPQLFGLGSAQSDWLLDKNVAPRQECLADESGVGDRGRGNDDGFDAIVRQHLAEVGARDDSWPRSFRRVTALLGNVATDHQFTISEFGKISRDVPSPRAQTG